MTKESDQIYFRFAEESDIPEILALLRSGLGESIIPKTEIYWRWKHFENPFGSSIVLLALQNDNLVGIRTFMRWRWKAGSEFVEAVRGVDTVVKPEFQGQGHFGRLTQNLLQYCQKRGYHFLFSTPNQNSKRAYKRLKWDHVGKLPVSIKLVKPISVIRNVISNHKNGEIHLEGKYSVANYLNHPEFSSLISHSATLRTNYITTAHSLETLRWRYAKVPVGRYFSIGVEEKGSLKGVCFFRFKTTRAGTELRVTDLFLEEWHYLETLKERLQEVVGSQDIDYVTSGSFETSGILGGGGLTIKMKMIGPTVMARNIILPDLKTLANFKNWKPSLGDLELF